MNRAHELLTVRAEQVGKREGVSVEQATARLMETDRELRDRVYAERSASVPSAAHPAVVKLKALRKERGVTQVRLAVEMGIAQSEVSRFEASPRPTWDGVSRYAKAIGLSGTDLVREGVL